ncbi:MAG: HNH endonuclease [Actinomycetota bacterium]|nr:HNH endonuclease [Actinomycetota bacterium]
MELRIRLSTLLGRDQYPGELAGWGPVHAELARDLATTLTRAEWRYAITDRRGQLLHSGITRARPAGHPTRTGRSQAVVELQVPAATLRALVPESSELGGWVAVVADLAHRHAASEGVEGDRYAADADRRHPGTALRRHLQIRDRQCTFFTCRAPARATDQDHTRDHARGGDTSEDNLGGACRHDHRLKHEGGWTLTQPEPGRFTWTSRLGRTYQTWPSPIIETLPDPIPRDRDPYPRTVPNDQDWENSTILDEALPELEPPPPSYDPGDDPPPF